MLFKLALFQNLHASRSAARRDIEHDWVWYLQVPSSHGLPSSSSMKEVVISTVNLRNVERVANL